MIRKTVTALGAAAVILTALAVPAAQAAPKPSPAPPPNTVVEVGCTTDIYNGLGLPFLTGAHPKDPWNSGYTKMTPLGFGPTTTESGVIPGQPPKWQDAGDAAIVCNWTTSFGVSTEPPMSGTVWLSVDPEYKVNIDPGSTIDVVCGAMTGQYIAPDNFTDQWQPQNPAQPKLAPVSFGERRALFVADGDIDFGLLYGDILLPSFGPKGNGSLKDAVDCSYSTVTYVRDIGAAVVTGTVYGNMTVRLK